MQEIINCPNCSRKLQVPENLIGQDVQCPTCGQTFVANVDSAPPLPPPTSSGPPPIPTSKPVEVPPESDYGRQRSRERYVPDDEYYDDDYEDDYDRAPRRRRRRRDLTPHRGGTVLTLGILSLFCFGPILGPTAWIMGQSDMKEIREGRMDPDGEGMTNAGRIIGIISSVLWGLYVLFLCLVFAAGIANN